MSELRIEWRTMRSATLGPTNPLPPLRPYASASSGSAAAERCLPYRMQDRYDRVKTDRCHKTAVLENDRLRATFLLDLGGRLWSLLHKPSNRELLMVNPVFQPANLAIRNAWFAGGVEWNVSKFGHCPFTCSPLHAAQIAGPGGEPVLRLYEYERCRDVPFQIDFFLPDGSDFLFASPRIVNPHEQEIPMYWWTNVAVAESDSTRVLAPAETALGHGYEASGARKPVSLADNGLTFPRRQPFAIDLYFVVPEGRRPWAAAVEGDGLGLVHVSSPRLFGRKMFVWGMNEGGRRWQEFLSEPGSAYLEIQGGLARTQSEYVPMPAGAVWSWLEALGPIELEPADAFGEWDEAWRSADAAVERLLPASRFEEVEGGLARIQRQSPRCILHQASGWGYVEARRRELSGEPPMDVAEGMFLRDMVGPGERPWLQLLEEGSLPPRSASEDPGETIAGTAWKPWLERSPQLGRQELLHLGVIEHNANNLQEAIDLWNRANAEEPSAWAHRNLAVAHAELGQPGKAWEHYRRALALLPSEKSLAVEASSFLLDQGMADELAELAVGLDPAVRQIPRVRLALARGALHAGRLEEVGAFFASPFELHDLREGDNAVTDLWFDFQAAKIAAAEGVPVSKAHKEKARQGTPPPKGFDFRMHNEP